MVCSYCQKPGHTKDKCWKLHGKPTNYQNLNPKFGPNEGYINKESGLAHISTTQKSERIDEPFERGELNSNEIEKLRSLLETLQKTPSQSSQAKLSAWIIDSGVTDHMTHSSPKFITYSPCSSNKKISKTDGTLVTVAGQGDIKLFSNITLKNVLHIPRLTVDVISVKNLIKDLGCKVIFSHSSCRFGPKQWEDDWTC